MQQCIAAICSRQRTSRQQQAPAGSKTTDKYLACCPGGLPSPALLQIGISPTIPLDAKQLLDIPLSGEAFCRFAQTDAAPKLF